MPKLSSMLPRGIRRVFRLPETRERLMRDGDDEMRIHLELWTEEFRSRGMSDDEATAAALERFGDRTAYRAHVAERAERRARWQRIVDWCTEWRQDVRFAMRHFSKTPGFTAIAVLTLALGIGADTAIFTVVHSLLIDPIPYPNGARIVALKTIGHPGFYGGIASMVPDAPSDPPPALVRTWAERAHSFEEIAGVEQLYLSIKPNGEQDTVSHAFATANFLEVLGTRPSFGRSFRPEEEKEGANHVAMISHRWWQLAYGGRPDALGKSVEFNNAKYTIVGVMPAGFSIPMSPRQLDWLDVPTPDVWIPARIGNTSIGFGLLRASVSKTAATNELNAIANSDDVLRKLFPGPGRQYIDSIRARAMRPQDFLGGRELRTIEILFAAVGALLLIACANVANLLLVRAWTRRREFAVRMGLGAGRARLIRLALTESVLLAIAAGVVGTLIAWQGLRVIIALRPRALDRLADVHIEPAVLFWTAAISILTGVLFGGASAIVVASQNVADLLRSETHRFSGSVASRRVRATLIVAEIALSFALLVSAGLLTRSFAALSGTRLGFDPHNLVSIDLLTPAAIRRSGRRPEVRRALVERLSQVPGVTSSSVGMLPTTAYRGTDPIAVDSPDGIRTLEIPEYMTTWIDGAFFRTSGIALIAGRAPRSGASDEPPQPGPPPPPPGPVAATGAARVTQPPLRTLSEEVVVSRALARRIAPDGNVVGRRIRLAPTIRVGAPPTDDWSTIVGVADDVRLPGARSALQDLQIFGMPIIRPPEAGLLVRFSSLPANVESVLRDAIHTVEPTIVARRARVADDYVRDALAPTRFTLALLGTFAVVALVLAVVGLYGSIAYSVTQRTREIGIRVALGATSKAVTALVVSDGVRLAGVGLLVGLGTGIVATRALSSLLYSVSAGDPATFVATSIVVVVVALVASYVPARRALRIDPIDALRAD